MAMMEGFILISTKSMLGLGDDWPSREMIHRKEKLLCGQASVVLTSKNNSYTIIEKAKNRH